MAAALHKAIAIILDIGCVALKHIDIVECKLRICEIGDNGRSDGKSILRSCPQQERGKQIPN